MSINIKLNNDDILSKEMLLNRILLIYITNINSNLPSTFVEDFVPLLL